MGYINRIKRTAVTLKYLKPGQVFYRVKYSLFSVNKLNQKHFSGEVNNSFELLGLPEQKNVISQQNHLYTADILNLKKTYTEKVNWADLGYGRLWNYNLQYGDFLNQHNLTTSQKKVLILDLYHWLINGKIAPEPYPSSLRIMNLIRFLYSQSNVEESSTELLDMLYSELCFLTDRFEYHLSGNHLLENAFALHMGGTYLNNIKWVNKARKLLEHELQEQILDDGAHYERSPMYHNIILFRVLEAISYTDTLSEFHLFLKEIAEKMLSWMQKITFGNGDLPNVNDSLNGVALSSSSILQSARRLNLNTGISIPLNSSGYRFYSSKIFEVLADINGIKPDHQPGHAHADSLSFILYAYGKPVIVDPGISTYDNNEIRHWERSTAAHNTITLNDENTADVWHSFRVGDRPDVKILEETESSVYVQLSCKTLRNQKFNHKRRFHTEDHIFMITDKTDQTEMVTGRLFCSPDAKIIPHNSILEIITGTNILFLQFENATDFSLFNYDYAIGFNKRIKSTGIVYHFHNVCKLKISEGK